MFNWAKNHNNEKHAPTGKQYRAQQSEKARHDRPITNDEGITLDDVIRDLARVRPDEKPSELWTHIETAISEWSGDCEGKIMDPKERDTWFYEFTRTDGIKDTISYQNHA